MSKSKLKLGTFVIVGNGKTVFIPSQDDKIVDEFLRRMNLKGKESKKDDYVLTTLDNDGYNKMVSDGERKGNR